MHYSIFHYYNEIYFIKKRDLFSSPFLEDKSQAVWCRLGEGPMAELRNL
jgi:hypothetical protein